MNPADVYRQQSVLTAPLPVKLAKLHERGALLTRQVRHFTENNEILRARDAITQIEDIITFLRSSLNPDLEVSSYVEATYIFYYDMAVSWYIDPNKVSEGYDSMLEFWESWARTWSQVRD
ncbi:flagellar protein FliS [Sulfoacidibacillus thermotolerans]|uniref:Flagellar protein FliS n=1 Tax=Sulfoacidibacillus thermotolerans TaxID=1765684 RepID=A0A2U3D7M6_SULT2|nr:flagellar protein FliS [Sulfoacidibacillus thermotolerans]PWI57281.1 hypothetical protein BM613_09290 [Sulfoacidibacillus thermotolerans]